MDRALRVLAAAAFLGLMGGVGAGHVGVGLGTFVIVFLVLSGYEFYQRN